MTSDDRGDTPRGARSGGDGDEVRRDLDDLRTDFGALIAAHPVGALATAVGVGYALGGGVFTRLTSRLLRLGLRLGIQFAVMPVIEQELGKLVGLGRPSDDSGEDAPGRGTTHH
jgi:hypothetical protein